MGRQIYAVGGQGVSSIEANTFPPFVEVIGGLDYYRLSPSDFATIYFSRWGEISFNPWQEAFADDGAGGVAATVGLAVRMTPHRMCLWLVKKGETVLPNGQAVDSNTCIILSAGQAVDLGGWEGDLLFREEPGPIAVNAGASWQNGAQAAILGTIVTFVIDPLQRYVGARGEFPELST